MYAHFHTFYTVPVILSGPMNVILEYSDNVMATFTCTAFGGSGSEIEFYWSTVYTHTTFISIDETLNADNSTTSTATTTIISLQDREGLYRCSVYYSGHFLVFNTEIAILSIGKENNMILNNVQNGYSYI